MSAQYDLTITLTAVDVTTSKFPSNATQTLTHQHSGHFTDDTDVPRKYQEIVDAAVKACTS